MSVTSGNWTGDGRGCQLNQAVNGMNLLPIQTTRFLSSTIGLQPATRWRDAGVRGDSSQVESALGQAYPVRSLLGQTVWFGMGGGTQRRAGVGCIGGGVGSCGVSRPQDLTAQ